MDSLIALGLIETKGMVGAIEAKTVTYDLHRLMKDATKVKTSEFGDAIIEHM